MQLKNYQTQALDLLDRYLDELKAAARKRREFAELLAGREMDVPDEIKNHPGAAWRALREKGLLPSVQQDGASEIPDYVSRTGEDDEPIPHVCLKVPTGGGKTLLAVTALERIKRGTGFVLWVVPTKAIFEQTDKAFRTREHPYRQILERISGGRVKLLKKTSRFTRQDVENYLCVMLLMLPSANRRRNTEFLKIFRDSGGYTSFFPEQDDTIANRNLLQLHLDLETIDGGDHVKQSLINTLKMIRPAVVLDEAHKAYGANDTNNREFVKSVNKLNPRFVLELSATPKAGISNILVNISGVDLKNEEMIKLPIHIHSPGGDSDWKSTLAKAQEKLNALEEEARKLRARTNRYVRPIALVRVERTGADQAGGDKIHSDAAKRYLMRNLSVPENEIKIQSSEKRELEGEDLLDERSSVRWIITKDALKEGWDCSFAYVLALLDNTTATTAMTQMVGRIMRQPYARRIEESEVLNQCYIYCYNKEVRAAIQKVKEGLEKEGLTGLGDFVRGQDGEDMLRKKTIGRRGRFKNLEIFLPQVLHKDGDAWRLLDYDRDILSALDWSDIDVGEAVDLDDKAVTRDIMATIDILGRDETVSDSVLEENGFIAERLTLEYFARRLEDSVPNPWHAARMAERFIEKHRIPGHDESALASSRVYLSEVLRGRTKKGVNDRAEAAFCDKVGRNDIRFHLERDSMLDYELGETHEILVAGRDRVLQGGHGAAIQKSLFDPVYEKVLNGLENKFALYLDESEAIHWWHRIAARQSQEYALQGWKRGHIYPDFIACQGEGGVLMILETKGLHLKGNPDTDYKQKLLRMLEKIYAAAHDRGEMTVSEPRAVFRMMFECEWHEDMNRLVADNRALLKKRR